jgi:hypothetical protein
MIAHGNEKDLRFMFQSSKGFGMDDSITIMLKGWPEWTFLLKELTASCL